MLLDVLVWILAALGTYVSLIWISTYFKEKRFLKQRYMKLKNPLMVSIAIPAYNEEANIENAIDSLLKCDYPKDKLEIIVINDGSTDNTLKLLEKYRKKNQIKLLTQSNRGKGAALNNALKHAKGALFGVMDADTIVDRDAVSKLVMSFDAKDGAIISAIKPMKSKSILEKFQKVEYVLAIMARKLMDRLDANYVTPGALSLYNKSVLDKIGDFDEDNITEDLEMGLRLRAHGYAIKASVDAFTFTVVPKTFRAFFNQRLRWNRGFLKNIVKYRYMVLNPKYKTLGMYQLTMALLSILVMIPAGFLITGYFAYKMLYGMYLHFSAVGFTSPQFALPTLKMLLLGFNFKLYFPLMVSMLFAGFTIVLAHKLTNENYKSLFFMILTMMIYYPIVGIIWMASLAYEILGVKKKW